MFDPALCSVDPVSLGRQHDSTRALCVLLRTVHPWRNRPALQERTRSGCKSAMGPDDHHISTTQVLLRPVVDRTLLSAIAWSYTVTPSMPVKLSPRRFLSRSMK